MHDEDAWKAFPRHRKWFDKLWLSDSLGYHCGPSGTSPNKDGLYIVRPVYNLSGMGVGAQKTFIRAGDNRKVPPGYFWCEYFEGRQFSVTYEFWHGVKGEWKPVSSWEGVRTEEDLWRFDRWVRSSVCPEVPSLFNALSDVKRINVEFIEDKPFEVHLRDTPDPTYDEIIPVWKDRQNIIDKYLSLGYTYRKSFDDADGFLDTPRLGFMVKNKGD